MLKENSRRKFITNTAIAMSTTGLLASGCSAEKERMAGKFIHHVFFWLKEPVTDDVRARFEAALKELVTIEVIIDYHLGRPAATNREVIDSSYTYSLLTTFKNKQTRISTSRTRSILNSSKIVMTCGKGLLFTIRRTFDLTHYFNVIHAKSILHEPVETLHATSLHEYPQQLSSVRMSAISPKPGSLPVIIRSFKSAVTKNARKINRRFQWQSGYHDRIIRDMNEMERVRKYIRNNPLAQ